MPIAKIEKLVFGGQALGTDEESGKIVFLWDALPGEEVEYEITKKKKNYVEGIAVKILKKSKNRKKEKEKHFLSCSPWQILSFKNENIWKKRIAQGSYHNVDIEASSIGGIEIISGKNQFHYRNKMEYSFAEDEKGKIHLAFFHRGRKRRYPIKECCLAEKEINETAVAILKWVNEKEIPIRSLKSVILRSNNQGESIAALFIKDELTFDDYPSNLPHHCQGFTIYYSTHKSPASVPTKLLYTNGDSFLTTELNKTKLKFGLLSFFQVNISLFEKALKDFEKFLDPEREVVDYYAGVGAISLPLAPKCKNVILVESNEEAVNYANENIKLNKIKNAEAVVTPAEKMKDIIDKNKIIIFDPPRAGVHPKIIDEVLEKKPIRIIYMSCNLSTHARDMELLQEVYGLKFLKLYNFFPRTPHVEGLAVLDRK